MSRRAFTLVEALVSSLILVLALAAAMALSLDVDRHVAGGYALSDLDVRANRLQAWLRSELDELAKDTVVLTDTGVSPGRFTRLEYRQAVGYDSSTRTTTLSPALHRLEVVLEPGETANDADDDGDGLIDEGQLVLTVAGATTVIAAGVMIAQEDYGGGPVGQAFFFELQSGASTPGTGDAFVRLSVTLQGRDLSQRGETPAVLLRDLGLATGAAGSDMEFNFRN